MARLDARKVNENSIKIANQANPKTGKIRVWDKATGEPMDVWPVDAAEAVAMGSATLEKLDGPVEVEPEIEAGPEKPKKPKKKPAVKKNPPKVAAKDALKTESSPMSEDKE